MNRVHNCFTNSQSFCYQDRTISNTFVITIPKTAITISHTTNRSRLVSCSRSTCIPLQQLIGYWNQFLTRLCLILSCIFLPVKSTWIPMLVLSLYSTLTSKIIPTCSGISTTLDCLSWKICFFLWFHIVNKRL